MFEEKITSFINKHNLFPEKGSVVIGVSGGIDSMVLLYFFSKYFNNKREIYVAHVNHMLRGEESAGDYEFVRYHCQKLGLQFLGTNIDIAAKKKLMKANGQIVARKYRYRFFENTMAQLNGKYLVLAHHLDDQAETVVMNLIRGNGFLSYLGIPVVRQFAGGVLVRPFLGVSRADIAKYATTWNIEFREDRTNKETNYTRNRLRAEIIPLLKAENEQFLPNVALFSQFDYDNKQYLQQLLENHHSNLNINEYDTGFTIYCSELQKHPIPIQRGLFTLILKYLYRNTPSLCSVNHVESLLGLLANENETSRLQLAGKTYVIKSGRCLRFFYKESTISSYSLKINITGKTFLPNGDIILAEAINNLKNLTSLARNKIIVPADSTLFVRNKMAGDRVLVPSICGHKKIKKLFLEQRVPTYLRNIWPVILKNDKIIWIPYLYRAEFTGNEMKKYTCLSYISATLPYELGLTEEKSF